MKPRILHVCSDTNIGGAGRYVLTLLQQPRVRERFEIAVACPEGALAVALRSAGVTVLRCSGADTSFSWQALRSLWSLMRTFGPRVVHTHGSLAGRIAAALVGARIVYTKHGLAASEEQAIQVRSPGALLKRASVRLFADRLVAVSSAVRDSLVASGADVRRIRVIPGGVETDRYVGAGALVHGVVGALGRLSHEKGFDVLLEAMSLLRGEASLLLGGDGPQGEALRHQASALRLDQAVTFTGFVSDVTTFLQQTGLFVLPSRAEGLGLVLLEAMAAGRPVVAARVGGIPEVVVDEQTGLLVEPENPTALAGAIRRLLAEPGLAKAMGEAGRRRVQALFGAGLMAEQTAVLYEELINP